MLLLSVSQLVFFSCAMTRPHSLKVAFVSDELDDIYDCYKNNHNASFYSNGTCSITKASCLFFDELDKDQIVKVLFNTFEEAYLALTSGQVISLIHVKENFTEICNQLLLPGNDNSLFTSNLNIDIHNDKTNLLLAWGVEEAITTSMLPFYKRLFSTCKIPSSFLKLPISFKPPIFGTFDWDYRHYVMPVLLIT